jgi:hypothetical protein
MVIATNGNYQPMVQLGQMYLIMHRIQMLQQTPWLLQALPMGWTVSNIVFSWTK